MRQKITSVGKERRGEDRKMCFFAEVDYSVKNNVYTAPIKNISNGGVFIETNESFNIGADVAMLFSDYSNIDLIKVVGDVVRRMPAGIAVKFDMGVNKQINEMQNYIAKV